MPKPPAGLSVAARHSCGSVRRQGWRTAQTGSVCGRDGAGESSSSPRARGQTQKQSERATPIAPEVARAVALVRPEPRYRWPRFAHHYWPTKVSRALSQRWMRPNRMFRPAALLLADHHSRDSTGQPALGALKAFMLLAEAPAGSLTRCLLNLNSHNHKQHAGRPCFSLAIQIERSSA